MSDNTVYVTLDTDWAPDSLIDFSLDFLHKYQVQSTFFATNRTDVLLQSDPDVVEVGLHPNYTNLDTVESTLADLKDIYPDAHGVRSHTLLHGSRFNKLYQRLNMSWTSNYLAMFSRNIQPITNPGMIEYPVYFMDDAYLLMYTGADKFKVSSLQLETAGMKILAFHPIHIFLNTGTIEHYEKAKSSLHDFSKLKQLVNSGPGIRTLFMEVLDYLQGSSTLTLSEIALQPDNQR